MPKGQLFINNKDAFTEWGVSMDMNSLSALMAPAGLKELPSDDYRLQDGVDYILDEIKVAERQLVLTLNLSARNEKEFFERYLGFCAELALCRLDIKTEFQPNVTYHCIYQSCQQFSQFARGIAHFSLKLVEPNPTDR